MASRDAFNGDTKMKFVIHRNVLKAVSRFQGVKNARRIAFSRLGIAKNSLNGTFIEWNAMETRMVATDGRALIVHRSDAKEKNEGEGSVIIPGTMVKTMLSWNLENKWWKDRYIACVIDNGEIRAQCLNHVATGKPIDGKFLDYRKVIPETCTGFASFIDPEYLVMVKRASKDLGSDIGYFELKQNGSGNIDQSGDGASMAVINDSCFAVIMPMRYEVAGSCATNWAREALPALPAKPEK
jgi:hypothetical protein